MAKSPPSLPTILPTWLSEWARLCDRKNDLEDDAEEVFQSLNLKSTLHRLLSDVQIATSLSREEASLSKSAPDTYRASIKVFLQRSCVACWRAEQQKYLSRSEDHKQLKDITKKCKSLASEIKNLPSEFVGLGQANYLQARLKAGNPNAFINKRLGLRSSGFRIRDSTTIDQLLGCMAKDIAEQIAFSKQSSKGRKVAGKNAKRNGLIDGLIKADKLSFGSNHNTLIAQIASAYLEEDVTESSVRSRRI